MPLFSALMTGATMLMESEEIRTQLTTTVGKTIQKFDRWLDSDIDNDGDFDINDLTKIKERLNILASVWGHASQADEIVAEEEEEAFSDFIEMVVFNGDEEEIIPILPLSALKKFGLKKNAVKKELCARFFDPYPLERIVSYAQENDLESDIYELACITVNCDGEIHEKEVSFLNSLANFLDITSLDKRIIERRLLSKAP